MDQFLAQIKGLPLPARGAACRVTHTSPAGRFPAEQGVGVAALWNDADLDDAEHPRWQDAHPIASYALTQDVPIVPAVLSSTYVGHTIIPQRGGTL